MFKRNEEIRDAKGNLPWWVIAERLGIHENTLQLWMRTEMPPKKKQSVIDAITQIKDELERVAQ